MPLGHVRIRRLEMLREGREVEDTRDFGLSPDDVEIRAAERMEVEPARARAGDRMAARREW
jgi:hypothetical protein